MSVPSEHELDMILLRPTNLVGTMAKENSERLILRIQ